ncbi:MAG TPA: FecR domain-containing protein [Ramlibacter sp.]|nr:FecR domain-containing protein [Ramlibacter sp.]
MNEEADEAAWEAAAWRARLGDANASTRTAFQAWLASSPLNAQAWVRISTTWDQVGALADHPSMQRARHEALNHAGAWSRSRHDGRRLRVLAVVLAGVALCMTAWLQVQAPAQVTTHSFATSPGERSTISLPDGSSLALDQSTRVRVVFDDRRRRVELLAGQARFTVARDATRPFVVGTRDRDVTATGTVFNIDEASTRTRITLLEGQVVVGSRADRADSRPITPMVLAPAQQLDVHADRTTALRGIARPELVLAWEQGRLIFDDTTLDSVVEQINRHATYKIVLADAGLAGFKVSGVFRQGDSIAVVEGLQARWGLRRETLANGDIRLSLAARRPTTSGHPP